MKDFPEEIAVVKDALPHLKDVPTDFLERVWKVFSNLEYSAVFMAPSDSVIKRFELWLEQVGQPL